MSTWQKMSELATMGPFTACHWHVIGTSSACHRHVRRQSQTLHRESMCPKYVGDLLILWPDEISTFEPRKCQMSKSSTFDFQTDSEKNHALLFRSVFLWIWRVNYFQVFSSMYSVNVQIRANGFEFDINYRPYEGQIRTYRDGPVGCNIGMNRFVNTTTVRCKGLYRAGNFFSLIEILIEHKS